MSTLPLPTSYFANHVDVWYNIILHLWEVYAFIVILPDSFDLFRTFSDRDIAAAAEELAYILKIYPRTNVRVYYIIIIIIIFSSYLYYRCGAYSIYIHCAYRSTLADCSGKITSTVVNLVARRGKWYTMYTYEIILYTGRFAKFIHCHFIAWLYIISTLELRFLDNWIIC